jgi:hypothetical protein
MNMDVFSRDGFAAHGGEPGASAPEFAHRVLSPPVGIVVAGSRIRPNAGVYSGGFRPAFAPK